MSIIQRLVTSIVPRAWAQSMEAESRAWIARCRECGSAASIWDLGGIRWKAAGTPMRRLPCLRCGSSTSHDISRL